MNQLTKIYLGGSLGKRFGTIWELDVKSPSEAIRAIDANTRGAFGHYLGGEARNKPFKVCLQNKKNTISAEECSHKSGQSAIYILPTIRGKSSGVKMIVGAVLIIVGAILYNYGGSVLVKVGIGLIGAGASLVIGGITQALTPTPRLQQPTTPLSSTSFPGNAATIVQGGCVPIAYGHILVPAVPVSITTQNYDTSTTQVGYSPGGSFNNGVFVGGDGIGGVGQVSLQGGGLQYIPLVPQTTLPY